MRKTANDYRPLKDGTVELSIPYRGEVHTALIDEGDFDQVRKLTWRIYRQYSGNLYVTASRRIDGRPTTVELGRYLLGLGSGREQSVIHLNDDTLDYRRENLQVLSMGDARVKLGAYGDPGEVGNGLYETRRRLMAEYRQQHGLKETGRLPNWALRELREKGVL